MDPARLVYCPPSPEYCFPQVLTPREWIPLAEYREPPAEPGKLGCIYKVLYSTPDDAEELLVLEDEFIEDHKKLILEQFENLKKIKIPHEVICKSVGLSPDRNQRRKTIKSLTNNRKRYSRTLKLVKFDPNLASKPKIVGFVFAKVNSKNRQSPTGAGEVEMPTSPRHRGVEFEKGISSGLSNGANSSHGLEARLAREQGVFCASENWCQRVTRHYCSDSSTQSHRGCGLHNMKNICVWVHTMWQYLSLFAWDDVDDTQKRYRRTKLFIHKIHSHPRRGWAARSGSGRRRGRMFPASMRPDTR